MVVILYSLFLVNALIMIKRRNLTVFMLMLSILAILSCKRNHNSDILTGNSFKYWRYTYGKKTTMDSLYLLYANYTLTNHFLYFDRHGKCLYYKGENSQSMYEYRNWFFNDSVWEIRNDSIIWIMGTKMTIRKITKEEVWLYDVFSGRMDTMRAVSREAIPSRLRRYYHKQKSYKTNDVPRRSNHE